VLGDDVQLLPHVVCYSGTVVGSRVILHAGVRLGSDGFGYIPGKNGRCRARCRRWSLHHRDDVEIGANTTIDRGSVDDTVVGPGTKDRQPRPDRAQLSHRRALPHRGSGGDRGQHARRG